MSTDPLSPEQVAPRRFFYFALLFVVLYIGTSFWPAIFDDTEGQYAGAAREMLERGDWLMPTNNYIPRIQKPPLLYWMQMTCYELLGRSVFSARLPNALGLLTWLWTASMIGRQVAGPRGAFATLAILGTMCGFFVFGHLVQPEPIFACFINLTIWSFLKAWKRPEQAQAWFTASWGFMGMACFSKGLHGAVWPLMAAGVTFLACPPSRKFWLGLISWRGFLLYALIMVPWYWLAEKHYPGFWSAHFGDEQIALSVDQRSVPTSEQVELWVFLVQHLFLWLPGALFLPAAFSNLKASWKHDGKDWDKFPGTLMAGWFGIVLITSCFSGRQDYYTMSSWTAIAVFLSAAYTSTTSKSCWSYKLPGYMLTVFGVLGFIAAALIIQAVGAPSELVPTYNERAHLWDTLKGFPAQSWRDALPILLTTAASMLIGGLYVVRAASMGDPREAVPATAKAMIIPLLCAGLGFGVMEEYFSLKKVADYVNEKVPVQAIVVYDGEPNTCASLFYYMDRRTHLVRARANAEFGPRDLGVGLDHYLDHKEFLAKWQSSQPVYLITEEKDLGYWKERIFQNGIPAELARSGTRILLGNGR